MINLFLRAITKSHTRIFYLVNRASDGRTTQNEKESKPNQMPNRFSNKETVNKLTTFVIMYGIFSLRAMQFTGRTAIKIITLG